MKETEKQLKTIYAIKCEATGRIYIGCCQGYENRIRAHFNDLRNGRKTVYKNGKHIQSQWQKDFNEHGRDSFLTYVIEKDVPKEQAIEKEFEYIAAYKSAEPEYGYNIIKKRAERLDIIYGAPDLPKG